MYLSSKINIFSPINLEFTIHVVFYRKKNLICNKTVLYHILSLFEKIFQNGNQYNIRMSRPALAWKKRIVREIKLQNHTSQL